VRGWFMRVTGKVGLRNGSASGTSWLKEPRGSAASPKACPELVEGQAPALDAVVAHGERPSRPLRGALRHEVVGSYSREFSLERARRAEPALDRRPDGGGDVVFASIGVDDYAAQRLRRRNVEERPP
jgi:hypothetical protein